MINRKVVVMLGAALMTVSAANAAVSFSWATSTARIYSGTAAPGNELTPVNSTASGYNIGCFVQLIYAADGLAHDSTGIGNGVDGVNNIVIAVSWLGRSILAEPKAGRFSGQSFNHNYAAGSKFFLRAWSAPSTTFNGTVGDVNAVVPIGASVGYGNSILYTTVADPTSPGVTDRFYLGDFANGSFAVSQVPEPATVTLFGLGALALAIRRKLRA